VKTLDPQMRAIDVHLDLHFWNRNYVGTHFGGSIYAMADPFFMLMLIENLGPDFVVWDKAASVRFRKPGRGRITAKFRLTPEQIEEVRRNAELKGKYEPVFVVEVRDEQGDVVAEVEKLLYVRYRPLNAASAKSLVKQEHG
jgi:acyl-coenzyme A thioesterase PaaI-like protein